MHFEGNIFYHVMPSCITFYLAVSGFSFSNIQVEADLEYCQIQGTEMLSSLFSIAPRLHVRLLKNIWLDHLSVKR